VAKFVVADPLALVGARHIEGFPRQQHIAPADPVLEAVQQRGRMYWFDGVEYRGAGNLHYGASSMLDEMLDAQAVAIDVFAHQVAAMVPGASR
jgi:hypothetical protein